MTYNPRKNIATGAREEREGLVRWFVGPDSTPWPDWTGRSAKLGGRGVWLEPSVPALVEAVKRGGFAKGFRQAMKGLDAEVLLERMLRAGRKFFLDRLGLANRAGALAIGQMAVRERMRGEVQGLLLVASDAGASNRTRFERHAARLNVSVVRVPTGAELGNALGREFVSVALVDNPAFTKDLERTSRALAAHESTGFEWVELEEVEGVSSAEGGHP